MNRYDEHDGRAKEGGERQRETDRERRIDRDKERQRERDRERQRERGNLVKRKGVSKGEIERKRGVY